MAAEYTDAIYNAQDLDTLLRTVSHRFRFRLIAERHVRLIHKTATKLGKAQFALEVLKIHQKNGTYPMLFAPIGEPQLRSNQGYVDSVLCQIRKYGASFAAITPINELQAETGKLRCPTEDDMTKTFKNELLDKAISNWNSEIAWYCNAKLNEDRWAPAFLKDLKTWYDREVSRLRNMFGENCYLLDSFAADYATMEKTFKLLIYRAIGIALEQIHKKYCHTLQRMDKVEPREVNGDNAKRSPKQEKSKRATKKSQRRGTCEGGGVRKKASSQKGKLRVSLVIPQSIR